MSIELDDFDQAILKECPINMDTSKKTTTRMQAAKMKRIKRLWTNGLVRGTVGHDGKSLKVEIRDAGRLAIGSPAIETLVAEQADAPAA
jgi:hypothetical protein